MFCWEITAIILDKPEQNSGSTIYVTIYLKKYNFCICVDLKYELIYSDDYHQ